MECSFLQKNLYTWFRLKAIVFKALQECYSNSFTISLRWCAGSLQSIVGHKVIEMYVTKK